MHCNICGMYIMLTSTGTEGHTVCPCREQVLTTRSNTPRVILVLLLVNMGDTFICNTFSKNSTGKRTSVYNSI